MSIIGVYMQSVNAAVTAAGAGEPAAAAQLGARGQQHGAPAQPRQRARRALQPGPAEPRALGRAQQHRGEPGARQLLAGARQLR